MSIQACSVDLASDYVTTTEPENVALDGIPTQTEIVTCSIATQTVSSTSSVGCQTILSGEDVESAQEAAMSSLEKVVKLQESLKEVTISEDTLSNDNQKLKFYTGMCIVSM